METVAHAIYRRVLAANKILLVPHQNPDGDTLGSVAAFMQWLRQLDKPHVAFCATGIAPKLRFLPHLDYVLTDPSVWEDPDIDLVIVFDSGDLRYAGVADHMSKLPNKPIIINIDHHATNELYGHHNMVMTTESSTTAILYRFFLANHIPIDQHIATCLMTGLINDTDHFTNGATSDISLAVAGKLIQKGADRTRINDSLLKNKTISGLKLWGTAFARLTYYEPLKLVHTYITNQDIIDHHAEESEYEGISNFFNNLSEGHASLIVKELPDGKIKGSFRTTRNDTDVAAYAKHLGGGGHKKAAGFTIDGPIETAIERIITAIETLNAN